MTRPARDSTPPPASGTTESSEGKVPALRYAQATAVEPVSAAMPPDSSGQLKSLPSVAASVAHDFNNILAAIVGYSELAQLEAAEEDQVRSHLDQVLKASLRAKELVKRLLDYIRNGRQEREPVLIASVVRQSLETIRPGLPPGTELRENITEEGAVTFADPGQIQQLLTNLVDNAVHALRGSGGTIEVSLGMATRSPVTPSLRMDPQLRLAVQDTGEGIASPVRERMFEPFFSTRPPGEADGLGLTVVREIVKHHHGNIIVDSTPGEGTTVEVFLPPMDLAARDCAGLPRGTERVLFIPGDSRTSEKGQTLLESLGYTVHPFGSTAEAVRAFENGSQSFDLILTDHVPPQVDGFEMVRAAHAIRPKVPVLLFCGRTEGITEREAAAFGFKRVLKKPLCAAELASAIRQVLDGTPCRPSPGEDRAHPKRAHRDSSRNLPELPADAEGKMAVR